MSRFLLAALALAWLAPSAAAQGMATDAAPTFGTLQPTTEAARLDLVVRGAEDFPEDLMMEGCIGYIDRSAPDAVVEWGGGDLRVWVQADFDPTLAVAGPDGAWTCDDDSEAYLPIVVIDDAPAGRYAVWMGSFSTDPTGDAAVLYAGPPPPRPVLDAAAAPSAGRIAAAGGFEAAQGAIEVAVQAGGPDSGGALDVDIDEMGTSCTGYLDASTPTAVVDYDAAGGTGTLTIGATAVEEDLVLAIVRPDGTTMCNDDFNGVDPLVSVEEAASGAYTVWVGTYRAVGDVPATLTVSETAPEVFDDFDFDLDGGFGQPYSEGSYTLLDLGRVPGPRATATDDGGSEVTLTVAPTASNPVQGMNCTGYIETAASAAVELFGDGPFAVRASSETDLTLTVRTPSGAWFCSDDADGLDPGIQLDGAEAGDYLVWIGTFSDDGSAAEATLSVEPGTVEYEEFTDGPFGVDFESRGDYGGTALSTAPAAETLDLTGLTTLTESVLAGGPVMNPVEGAVCNGFLPDAPTAALVVAEAGDLRVMAASDDDDLTLVLREPSGDWWCSDDADGSDPAIRIEGGAGTYEVWVGTFSRRDAPVPATLTVER